MSGKNALQGMIDGTRTGKREQTVLSPECVLGPLRGVWGRIVYDPCAPPEDRESLVRAQHVTRLPDDGLAYTWPDRTYCNPEYALLRPRKDGRGWLSPAAEDGARIAWLIPMRSHRAWWRVWAETCDVVIGLNTIAFVGHKSKFPAPLVLGYRGADADEIVRAFAHMGSPSYWGVQ